MRKFFSAKSLGILLSVTLLAPLVPVGFWLFANRWPFQSAFPTIYGWHGLQIFRQIGGISALLSSLEISFCVALIVLPIAISAVFYLGRDRSRPHPIVEILLFSPVFIPPFALVMGVSVASIILRIPEFLATVLTLATLALPYSVYVLRAAYRNYDSRWDDTGRVLGLNSLRMMIRVRLPILIKPISAAGLMALLVGWGDYIVTVIVGGSRVNSLPILLASMATSAGNDSAVSVVVAVGIVVPIAILLAIKSAFNLGKRVPKQ